MHLDSKEESRKKKKTGNWALEAHFHFGGCIPREGEAGIWIRTDVDCPQGGVGGYGAIVGGVLS